MNENNLIRDKERSYFREKKIEQINLRRNQIINYRLGSLEAKSYFFFQVNGSLFYHQIEEQDNYLKSHCSRAKVDKKKKIETCGNAASYFSKLKTRKCGDINTVYFF